MSDILPAHLQIVLEILKQLAPECEVRVFGSRHTGKAREYSDLDLVLLGDAPLGWKRMAQINEAFQESTLPYRVEVQDWHALTPEFQEVIQRAGYEVIQGRNK